MRPDGWIRWAGPGSPVVPSRAHALAWRCDAPFVLYPWTKAASPRSRPSISLVRALLRSTGIFIIGLIRQPRPPPPAAPLRHLADEGDGVPVPPQEAVREGGERGETLARSPPARAIVIDPAQLQKGPAAREGRSRSDALTVRWFLDSTLRTRFWQWRAFSRSPRSLSSATSRGVTL